MSDVELKTYNKYNNKINCYPKVLFCCDLKQYKRNIFKS